MKEIRITDVLYLCNIPFPNNRADVNIKCPYCDSEKNSTHLNVNLVKGVFRCAKCGVNGGIFDLFSLLTDTPRTEARSTILQLLGNSDFATVKKRATQIVMPEELPMADIDIRSHTLTALLSHLKLAPDHRDNLLNRGLTNAEIDRLGYKSTPSQDDVSRIIGLLQKEGCQLHGVAGFYNAPNGDCTMVVGNRGIMIPVRDIDGRIQGMQIRLDDATKRKYRWMSSANYDGGCRASSFTHFVKGVKGVDNLIITEGCLKADVISALCGRSVLAVAGVNALNHLRDALTDLKTRFNIKTVYTAFDMDFQTNPNVKSAMDNLHKLLFDMGFKVNYYYWNSHYKGLDDYLWECIYAKKRK